MNNYNMQLYNPVFTKQSIEINVQERPVAEIAVCTCNFGRPLAVSEKLKELFTARMKNEKIPLFRDFDTYAVSLPVGLYGGDYLKLHELSYWVKCQSSYLSYLKEMFARQLSMWLHL